MKRFLLLLLVPILVSCNSEEFVPEQEFVGTYELFNYAIYDEFGENILDNLLVIQPPEVELSLNRDGTYWLTEDAADLVVFCNGNFRSNERGGVIVGIWEVSDFAFSFHFDRGEFESVVEYEFYDDGIYFYQFPDENLYFNLEYQLYELGYLAGEFAGEVSNFDDTFSGGDYIGSLYAYYAGFYENTPVDEFGLSPDLIFNYTEGFFEGFNDSYSGVSSNDFVDGFYANYNDLYNQGALKANNNATFITEFFYSPEYDFIRK